MDKKIHKEMMDANKEKERNINYYVDRKQLNLLNDKLRGHHKNKPNEERPPISSHSKYSVNSKNSKDNRDNNNPANYRDNRDNRDNRNTNQGNQDIANYYDRHPNHYIGPNIKQVDRSNNEKIGTPVRIIKDILNGGDFNGNYGNYGNHGNYGNYSNSQYENAKNNAEKRLTWDNLDSLNFYDFSSNGKVNFNPNELIVEDDDELVEYNDQFNKNYIVDEKSFQEKYTTKQTQNARNIQFLNESKKDFNNNSVSMFNRNNSVNMNSNLNPNNKIQYSAVNPAEIKTNLDLHKRDIMNNFSYDPYNNSQYDSNNNNNNNNNSRNNYDSNINNVSNNNVMTTKERAQIADKIWEDKRTKVIIVIIIF